MHHTNVLDVEKAQNTVNSSAQQGKALAKNVTFFQRCITHKRGQWPKIREEDSFLGSLESQGETQWHTTVTLNQTHVKYKLDTGAEVTAISEATFYTFTDTKMRRPSKALHGPAKTLHTFKIKNTSCKLQVYVVRDLKTKDTALNLVARIQSILSSKQSIMSRYLELFTGMGILGSEY